MGAIWALGEAGIKRSGGPSHSDDGGLDEMR
jgi:hypothetical protein